MTLDEDRAEVERVAASWSDASEPEQQMMLAKLGRMLDYLGFEDLEYELRLNVDRLMTLIETSLGQVPKVTL